MISAATILSRSVIQHADLKRDPSRNPYTARRKEQLASMNRGECCQILSPRQALDRLKEGNRRFAEGKRVHPNQNPVYLKTIAGSQHPFATVISCSDSRVPVEHIFDVGFGDLFVIRIAGNVCATDEVGSIEYGVQYLETPILVVLGHSNCGAVTAVVEEQDVSGNIPALVAPIGTAVETAIRENPDLSGEDLVPSAITANVCQALADLFLTSPIARQRVKDGKLEVVGAFYELETGQVKWLGRHPEQDRLLQATTGPDTTFIHTVLFWLKEGTTDEQKQQLIDDCKTYLGPIVTVRRIDVGVPAGTQREIVDNSYDVSLVIYFDDKEGHDFYQETVKHLKFLDRNKPHWERVQVFDSVVK